MIVSAWDREQFLPEALESVDRQGLDPTADEVILNSNLPESAARRVVGDRPMRILNNDHAAQGPFYAQAVREAHGDVIAFLDDDDRWSPGRLAAVRRCFAEGPGLTYFHNEQRRVDERGVPLPRPPTAVRLSRQPSADPWGADGPVRDGPLQTLFKRGAFFNLSSTCVRLSSVAPFLPYLERVSTSDDSFFFYASVLSGGGFFLDPRPWTDYRVHSANRSRRWDAASQGGTASDWPARAVESHAVLLEMAKASGHPDVDPVRRARPRHDAITTGRGPPGTLPSAERGRPARAPPTPGGGAPALEPRVRHDGRRPAALSDPGTTGARPAPEMTDFPSHPPPRPQWADRLHRIWARHAGWFVPLLAALLPLLWLARDGSSYIYGQDSQSFLQPFAISHDPLVPFSYDFSQSYPIPFYVSGFYVSASVYILNFLTGSSTGSEHILLFGFAALGALGMWDLLRVTGTRWFGPSAGGPLRRGLVVAFYLVNPFTLTVVWWHVEGWTENYVFLPWLLSALLLIYWDGRLSWARGSVVVLLSLLLAEGVGGAFGIPIGYLFLVVILGLLVQAARDRSRSGAFRGPCSPSGGWAWRCSHGPRSRSS